MANKLQKAKQKTSELSANARNKARNALDASKSAAGKTVETSKRISSNAKAKTGETIETSPLAMVACGVAIGAIVAALLPKSEREKKVLGGAGRKLNDTAKIAVKAAKSAGAAHMVDVGLNSETLREQAKDIFQKGVETAKTASKAAKDAVKTPKED